jgi:uncharacterized protein YndB with AHSA1/START domain
MSEQFKIAMPADAPEIFGRRAFDAPRDLVFDAFSSPSQLAQWWGPTGFTLTTREMNFAPGGDWCFVMHGPDGRDYQNKIVFRVIERPTRIAYTHPGDDGGEPVSMETTIDFSDEAGGTRIDWRMRFSTIAERDRVDREYGAAKGLAQNLARLHAYIANADARGFVISRGFDAPRPAVWGALTEPARMAEWMGAGALSIVARDFRPGGRLHYSQRGPDGGIIWGRILYREIDPLARLVGVQAFSDEIGGVTRHPLSPGMPREWLSILSLEEDRPGARLTVRWLPIDASDAEREAFQDAREAMAQGWNAMLDLIATYLARG